GVTAHPAGLSEGGDLDHVQALSVPGLVRKSFEVTERHFPFSPSVDTFPPTDEPPPSAVSWAAFAAQLRSTGQASGHGCHFTGDGGDNLFLPPPTHLVTLVRNRRWMKMWNDACADRLPGPMFGRHSSMMWPPWPVPHRALHHGSCLPHPSVQGPPMPMKR